VLPKNSRKAISYHVVIYITFAAISTREDAMGRMTVVTLSFLIISTLFGSSLSAAGEPRNQLFNEIPILHRAARPVLSSESAKRQRPVKVNLPILREAVTKQAGALQLNLFPDTQLAAEITAEFPSTDGETRIWEGTLTGYPFGQVTIAETDGVLYALIRPGNRSLYEISYAGDGLHWISEIDTRRFRDEAPPRTPAHHLRKKALLPDAEFKPQVRATQDSGDIIDVLVVYTPAVKSEVGGSAAVTSKINVAISDVNHAYYYSDIKQRVRLVHKAQVKYTENADICENLTPLGERDGVIDQVLTWRDQYKADIVSLWVRTGLSSPGCGYQISKKGHDASYGFNIVSHTEAAAYHTQAHEMGHNMGAMHDKESGGGPGYNSYSYGYHQHSADPPYRTIMAYPCDLNCERVTHFSNPDVRHDDYKTGTASANNARTLNNTRTTVANWRPGGDPQPHASTRWGVWSGTCCGEGKTLSFTGTVGGVMKRSISKTCSSSGTWEGYLPTAAGAVQFNWTVSGCGTYKGESKKTLVAGRCYYFYLDWNDSKGKFFVSLWEDPACSDAATTADTRTTRGILLETAPLDFAADDEPASFED
jgi:peptidyl-Asp metalloendopeptidase